MKRNQKVKISVLMSVYNTPKEFLKESIESILNQSFKEFEFIIIDDGSSKDINEYLHTFKDSRIKVLVNKENIGLTKSLNIGLTIAKGKYIARMDSDDVSTLNRLQEQFQYMEANKNVIVVSSLAENLYTGKIITNKFINDDDIIPIRLLFYNRYFYHPCSMLRLEALKLNNIRYDEKILRSQDYKLWVDIAKIGSLRVLKNVHLKYRFHEDQISKKNKSEQFSFTYTIRKERILEIVPEMSKKDINIFLNILNYNQVIKNQDIIHTLKLIESQNDRKRIYDKKKIHREMLCIFTKRNINNLVRKKRLKDFISKYQLEILYPTNFFYFIKFYN